MKNCQLVLYYWLGLRLFESWNWEWRDLHPVRCTSDWEYIASWAMIKSWFKNIAVVRYFKTILYSFKVVDAERLRRNISFKKSDVVETWRYCVQSSVVQNHRNYLLAKIWSCIKMWKERQWTVVKAERLRPEIFPVGKRTRTWIRIRNRWSDMISFRIER